jgi:hypothetical protein
VGEATLDGNLEQERGTDQHEQVQIADAEHLDHVPERADPV